ncbi:MAG: flagellar hook-basal body complex protein [Proteobacteria bacterium]|nr:flagellar hook-basal body complex protein [Pseudomonadota bacterium]
MAFSSLYIGATGISALGDGMQVISNNLANVNTTGFKRSDTQFQTLISQQMATGSNPAGTSSTSVSQKGMGVTVGGVKTSFLQGGFDVTRTATDLAISGNGFFGVLDDDSGDMLYTRDGTFRFDKEGYLRSAQGYLVQGASIDRETGAVGSIAGIQLQLEEYTNAVGDTAEAVFSDPRATTGILLSTNLDSTASDRVTDSSDPFFAMFKNWNGLADNPMESATYTTSMKVFDENGASHDLTYYFDQVNTDSFSSSTPGYSYWEYVVGMDPDEDGRALFQGTSSAGLLSMGTLSFNKDGLLISQTAFGLSAAGADPTSLSNWSQAAFDAEGRVAFDVAFGGSGASASTGQTIGYSLGLISSNGTWGAGSASNASMVGASASSLQGMESKVRDIYGTTNYAAGSNTKIANQDGYTRGFLEEIYMGDNGTMFGSFSNGQDEGLFKVGVYRFNSEYGLRREGGNLFRETTESGKAIEGFAEEGGRGSIYGSSLEQSNVDMADQFVRMILNQRGYQSNTKVITTSDSILQTAISIKR